MIEFCGAPGDVGIVGHRRIGPKSNLAFAFTLPKKPDEVRKIGHSPEVKRPSPVLVRPE